MNIKKFIYDALWELEITQKELAKRLGKTPVTINNWIRGESEPRVSDFEKIKKMLEEK